MQKFATIKTNNRTEKTTVEVGGKPVEVVIPAKPGFNVVTYEAEQRSEDFLAESIVGQIVRVRYKIESPYGAKDKYNSGEFTSFNDTEVIKIYSEGNVIFTGNYKQAKQKYDSGRKNNRGGVIPTFSLKIVFYIDIGGEVVKLLSKFSGKIIDLMNSLDGAPITSKSMKFSTEVVDVAGSDKNVLKFEILGDGDPFKVEEFERGMTEKKATNKELTQAFNLPVSDEEDIDLGKIPF
jgi:hypothetical protein